ncbi:MAG: hypothetical protein LWW93_18140 [Hyphomicrobiales bacterium]|nr:hypothetical protein [Hyphomicrobiales bacterium]
MNLRCLVTTAALLVCPVLSVAAEEEDGRLWTDRPTRVDRSRETRERLPARSEILDGASRFALHVDEFPRIDGDASFLAEGRRWRIAHVELPKRSHLCPNAAGAVWACGLRAWATFGGLIADRTLLCRNVGEPVFPAQPVECWIREKSVAETLLAGGWADPAADAPEDLIAARRRAARARRGLSAIAAPP